MTRTGNDCVATSTKRIGAVLGSARLTWQCDAEIQKLVTACVQALGCSWLCHDGFIA